MSSVFLKIFKIFFEGLNFGRPPKLKLTVLQFPGVEPGGLRGTQARLADQRGKLFFGVRDFPFGTRDSLFFGELGLGAGDFDCSGVFGVGGLRHGFLPSFLSLSGLSIT